MASNNSKAGTGSADPLESEEIIPPEEATIAQAQRVVAAFAEDADECRTLFAMLGIGPAAPEE